MSSYQALAADVASVTNDRGFQSESAQIKAKALLTQVAEAVPSYRWSYIPHRVIRNLAYATDALQLLSVDTDQPVPAWSAQARLVASIWEALAKLREGTTRDVALLNAAATYELAGYHANAAYIARQLVTPFDTD